MKIALLEAQASNPEPVTEADVMRCLSPKLDAFKCRMMTIVTRVERENEELRCRMTSFQQYDERREERRARQVEADAAWSHENPIQAIELPVHGFYVYVLWKGTQPIYVGSSRNVLSRMGQHLHDRTKAHLITRITVKQYRDEARMLEAESHLIARHQPSFNVIGVVRPSWTSSVAAAVD